MRKRQIVAVKEMIDIVVKAHNSLYKAISLDSIDENALVSISKLLTGCQNTAINIGNIIEESEGEGFITVKYLEEYCELVYSVNEELCNTESSYNPDKISKKLNKMILKIENSIKHDIPLKREAVFLPYKASMWDSLESVWEAADADPDCDAYVIPIPYFDKKPDGSVREEHYEADLFPENVPITHYSEYDFGQHHPDMIFIHNPYDYGNLVTTIHPFFYAENMKKVTDCLVYIPYFATSGGMSESRAWCPVYDYVDYIVIQSENYRKYYSADIPDEKFLALGSPKFDKVIKKCQNPPELSEEWKKKTQGRRVFFYNTSLNGMLQDTPQFLKKMQYVFETFKKHPECCLLWRPHPLFESTLHAMRPGCIEVFDALKQDFMKQSNWIYDDTPCVEDTIAICDGYIGDSMSSVVALFGVAGKPIFILDNRIDRELDKEEYENINSITPIKAGNGYLQTKYSLINGNTVFEKKEGKEYSFCCRLSEYSEPSQYMFAYEYKEKVYVFPALKQEIIQIENGVITERILLEKVKSVLSFFDYYVIDKYVFLIPFEYPYLVRFDMETEEIQYVRGIVEFCKIEGDVVRAQAATWKNGAYICFLSGDGTKILSLNYETLAYDVKATNTKGAYRTAQIDEKRKCIWLFPLRGNVIKRLFYDEGKIDEIVVNYPNLQAYSVYESKYGDSQMFYSVGFMEDGYILAPYWANKFIKFDNDDNIIGEYMCDIKLNDKDVFTSSYKSVSAGFFVFDGEKQIYTSYVDGRKYIFEKGIFKEIKNDISFETVINSRAIFCDYNSSLKYVCMEQPGRQLDEYLKTLFENGVFDSNEQIFKYLEINACPEGDSGKRIYSYLID
ncbi:MAG: hypothetical protein E7275_04860 [Pseudobutyrivibrio sp.]|uniref:hypothetical protein n=1 Tax=Pseudobutyrivibrio sp. TaxID=2014367 RepID=UPI0025DDE357|nr:hypothetical protein [Pseudobutyrivibrio sp.]MBE5903598.1 hypothetical protein [Pseudobutyrivibrio sp.]